MEFTVTVKGLTELQGNFKKFHDAISQGQIKPMELAAEKAIEIIKKRTDTAQDVNYVSFKPYNPRYARKKRTTVNLKVSGDMLANIKFQAWAKVARIYLGAGLLWHIGKVHNVGGRSGRGRGFTMPKREFMGVSHDRDKSQIGDVMRKWWKDFARGLGL
jgi:phage gpG-like protein